MKILVRVLTLVIVVGLLAMPVGLVALLRARGERRRPYVPPRRANVDVVTVRRQDIDDLVVLPVVAECPEGHNVTVAAEIAGKVEWVGPRDGDSVKQGEVIVRIDTDALKAELDEEKASYTEGKLKYERINSLYEGTHASEDQLETARAAFERVAAQVTQAEVALEKGTVKSPIAGRVDRRYVDAGEYLLPGQRIANIVNIEKLYAVVEIPEADRQYLGRDMRVLLRFEKVRAVNPGTPYLVPNAVVRSVSDVGDPLTRTYRTQIEFDNRLGVIKPGMIGTVTFRRRKVENQVVVPKDFIVSSENERLVYVVADDRAIARPVVLGLTDGERFRVLKGLEPGELIVRDPRQLTPGDLIEVQSIDGKAVERPPGVPLMNPAVVVEEMKRRLRGHEAE